MNIDQIIHDREVLKETLNHALSTMDLKDDIREVHLKLLELQSQCPHYSTKYNWTMTDDICPYCGKRIGGGE